MTRERVWFVAERFERLAEMLFERGYAVDPGPRDPNKWHELHYEDPPTGLVRLKGIRLSEPEDENSDFDRQITFSMQELWSVDHVTQAQTERGYHLVAYSYHGHCHGVDQRWDFDPTGHPDSPYHQHPPAGGARRPLSGPISPEAAVLAFHAWIDERPTGWH